MVESLCRHRGFVVKCYSRSGSDSDSGSLSVDTIYDRIAKGTEPSHHGGMAMNAVGWVSMMWCGIVWYGRGGGGWFSGVVVGRWSLLSGGDWWAVVGRPPLLVGLEKKITFRQVRL